MRDKLEPVLPALHARDHRGQACADNGLRIERLSKRDALRRPFEAFLDDAALRGERRADDHPALVVEVAQDDLHALADRAERVRDRGTRAVERDVRRARRRRVRGLNRLGLNRVLARDEDHDVPFLHAETLTSTYSQRW